MIITITFIRTIILIIVILILLIIIIYYYSISIYIYIFKGNGTNFLASLGWRNDFPKTESFASLLLDFDPES